jgi:hypothetical protein
MSQKSRLYYKHIADKQAERDRELCARCNHRRVLHIGEKECCERIETDGCPCTGFVEKPREEEGFALKP